MADSQRLWDTVLALAFITVITIMAFVWGTGCTLSLNFYAAAATPITDLVDIQEPTPVDELLEVDE